MGNRKFRTRFELTDTFGNNHISESDESIYYSCGERELDVLGERFNVFLKQCGYVRKNDYIFMEDVTESEYDALSEYLHNLRNDNSGTKEE